MREGLDDLDAALDQHVGPAAVIARDSADHDAEVKAMVTQSGRRQRDPRAINDARQAYPGKPIGAEHEQLAALRGQTSGNHPDQAPSGCTFAMEKEPDRLRCAGSGV